MDDLPVNERLKQARLRRGEDIATIARRIGVRERLLLTIDEGRFGELPTGIYARTAVRLYAKGVALDADEIIAACESLLPVQEDPVSDLARLRGLKPATTRKPPLVRASPVVSAPHSAAESLPFPPWRPLAAVALDGFVVATLLLVAVAGTMTLSGGRASSLGPAAAPVFAVLGVVLGSCYFLFFGGIACATAGERLVGMRVGRRSPRAHRSADGRGPCGPLRRPRYPLPGAAWRLGRDSAAVRQPQRRTRPRAVNWTCRRPVISVFCCHRS